MLKKEIKYIGKDKKGIKGQSYIGYVSENDIIEVDEADYNRLINKSENGKPLFEAVKKQKAKKEAEEINE